MIKMVIRLNLSLGFLFVCLISVFSQNLSLTNKISEKETINVYTIGGVLFEPYSDFENSMDSTLLSCSNKTVEEIFVVNGLYLSKKHFLELNFNYNNIFQDRYTVNQIGYYVYINDKNSNCIDTIKYYFSTPKITIVVKLENGEFSNILELDNKYFEVVKIKNNLLFSRKKIYVNLKKDTSTG